MFNSNMRLAWDRITRPVAKRECCNEFREIGRGDRADGRNGAWRRLAGTIVSGPERWNTDNVDVGAGPDAEGTAYSLIYESAPTDPGARTYVRDTFDDAEASSPGINGADQGSIGTPTLPGVVETSDDKASNCLMASSAIWCDTPH